MAVSLQDAHIDLAAKPALRPMVRSHHGNGGAPGPAAAAETSSGAQPAANMHGKHVMISYS